MRRLTLPQIEVYLDRTRLIAYRQVLPLAELQAVALGALGATKPEPGAPPARPDPTRYRAADLLPEWANPFGSFGRERQTAEPIPGMSAILARGLIDAGHAGHLGDNDVWLELTGRYAWARVHATAHADAA